MRDALALKDEELSSTKQQLERLSTMIVELTLNQEHIADGNDEQELVKLLTSAKMELATQALDHEQKLARIRRQHSCRRELGVWRA